jgi:hypothetical protein
VDVVIAPSDVKLGIPLLAREVVNEVRDQWEWVLIRYHPFVEVSIILHRAISSILLFNEEEATRVGRFGSLNSLEA